MSLLLCIWFALKIFLGLVLVIGSWAAFIFSILYSFAENGPPFKPWKMIVFPLVTFFLVVMWTYIVFNVDIEKYMAPPTQITTSQIQTNNSVQLENK